MASSREPSSGPRHQRRQQQRHGIRRLCIYPHPRSLFPPPRVVTRQGRHRLRREFPINSLIKVDRLGKMEEGLNVERGALGAPANGTLDLLPAFSCSAFLSPRRYTGAIRARARRLQLRSRLTTGDWQLICSSQRPLTLYRRCKND